MNSSIFLLFLLLVFSSFIFSSSLNTTVYLQLVDISNFNNVSADGASLPWDLSPLQFEVPIGLSDSVRFDAWESISPYLASALLSGDRKNFNILSAKKYSKYSADLPRDLIDQEMQKSNLNKSYVSDDLATLQYLAIFTGQKILTPKDKPYQIRHELVEVCLQRKTGNIIKDLFFNDYVHIIVDRGTRGSIPNLWNTRMRIIYNGRSNNCDLKDNRWADKKLGKILVKGELVQALDVVGEAKVGDSYNLGDLVDDMHSYMRNYPNYNVLYNCQHYATNYFNKIAKQKTPFSSEEIMVLKDKNGKTNYENLFFNFPKVNK